MATKKVAPRKSTPKVMMNDVRPQRMTAEDRRWRAQEDIRTLQRAEEIKRDRQHMSHAQREAKSQITTLSKVVK